MLTANPAPAGPAATVASFDADDTFSNPQTPGDLVDAVTFGYVKDPEQFAAVLEKAAESAPRARYQVGAATGHLGSYAVCDAVDLEKDRQLKMVSLRTQKPTDEQLADLEKRVESVTALRNPRIAPVHGHGRRLSDAHAYYTTDFGGDGILATMREGAGAGDIVSETAIELWLGVADVISKAHAAGVAHGAIGPEHLRRVDGEVVVHWGLAAAVDGPDVTPYTAPELLDGEDLGSASDVYGLGAVLYHLVCGQAPYSGEGEMLAETVKAGGIPTPSEKNPSVPLDLESILTKATNRYPDQRHGSVQELAREIRDWQERAANPVSTSELRVRSGPPWWLIAIVVVVCLFGLAVSAVVMILT